MQFLTTSTLLALLPAFLSILSPAGATAIPIENTNLQPAEHAVEKRFNHGRCGIHVTQWQNPAGIDMVVKDGGGGIIGNILRTNFNGYTIFVRSQLPYGIVVTLEKNNVLQFKLGGDAWSTTDSRCGVGGFDHGARQMDCGFAC